MTDGLQKTCALLEQQVKIKMGTLSGHTTRSFELLIPAPVSPITYSICAQFITES